MSTSIVSTEQFKDFTRSTNVIEKREIPGSMLFRMETDFQPTSVKWVGIIGDATYLVSGFVIQFLQEIEPHMEQEASGVFLVTAWCNWKYFSWAIHSGMVEGIDIQNGTLMSTDPEHFNKLKYMRYRLTPGMNGAVSTEYEMVCRSKPMIGIFNKICNQKSSETVGYHVRVKGDNRIYGVSIDDLSWVTQMFRADGFYLKCVKNKLQASALPGAQKLTELNIVKLGVDVSIYEGCPDEDMKMQLYGGPNGERGRRIPKGRGVISSIVNVEISPTLRGVPVGTMFENGMGYIDRSDVDDDKATGWRYKMAGRLTGTRGDCLATRYHPKFKPKDFRYPAGESGRYTPDKYGVFEISKWDLMYAVQIGMIDGYTHDGQTGIHPTYKSTVNKLYTITGFEIPAMFCTRTAKVDEYPMFTRGRKRVTEFENLSED